MENMRFKVGDRVKIKSLDWYNENKDEYGYIDCGSRAFFTKMSNWCGKIATIKEITKANCYRLEEYDFDWTDEMIEGLVEEDIIDIDKFQDDNEMIDIIDECVHRLKANECQINLPEGYIFKDENGNVINATKIVLEKKKKEYPKTFEECCKILGVLNVDLCFNADYRSFDDSKEQWKRLGLMNQFYKLHICRDAYWKIAGEEMGLGKPWEPDWVNLEQDKHCIWVDVGDIILNEGYRCQHILTFPTAEMRDAFYENFKEEIEICKELL